MNIFTPYSFAEKQCFSKHAKEYISIELVSPSVNSGHFIGHKANGFVIVRLRIFPTTQCFLFFRSGFHTAIESLYFYRKTLLKYIQTILETYFTGVSIDLLPTAYKLSKSDVNVVKLYGYYISKNKRIQSKVIARKRHAFAYPLSYIYSSVRIKKVCLF